MRELTTEQGPDIRKSVEEALADLEAKEGFRVLFACESGSRAWGFASPDSDYDVRFIYVFPLPWYLRVLPGDDTCERMLPGDLDLAGWELRKALSLFGKSNCGFYEWVGSPIVYLSREGLLDELKRLLPDYFNPIGAMYHYLGLAKRTYGEYLEAKKVKIKKVFYVLRPLLACGWIERYGTMPPTSFAELYADAESPAAVRGDIDRLLEAKTVAVEGELIALEPRLRQWMVDELARLAARAGEMTSRKNGDLGPLDTILQRCVILDGPHIDIP